MSSVGLDTGTLPALRTEDAELAHLVGVCFPESQQVAVLAITSLHLELARVHRITSEPNIGTIRLRWWLDAVDEIFGEKAVRKHPIALDIAAISALSHGLLDALIESHGQDLDGLKALNWTEASSLFASQRGNLFRLLLQATDQNQESLHQAANHLGVAYGVWRAIPGLGGVNDIPWVQLAPEDPNWIVQALTHLDQVDVTENLPKWVRALSRYLRSGLLLVAKDQLPRAVALQQSAAFGLWRRMFF